MFKTIKSQVLSVLLSFITITLLVAVFAFYYITSRKEMAMAISQQAENIQLLLLQDRNVIHGFFENETINPVFFYKGESRVINAHHIISNGIVRSLNDLSVLQKQNGFLLDSSIIDLEMKFSVYNEMVDNMIRQVLRRGFKDFGTEGRMRKFAHMLEAHDKEVGLINVLQLRRHEKDFIIRQEEQYIQKHERLISEIKRSLQNDVKLAGPRREEILQLLQNYSNEFKTLVFFEKKLGLRKYGGLKKSVDEQSSRIDLSLAHLEKTCHRETEAAIFRMELVSVISGLFFVVFCILAAVAISRKMSFAVSDLKTKISKFVESDFTKRTVLPISNSVNEVDALITNVSVMEQHIVDQMAMLKQSNRDLEMLFYATSRDIRSPLITVKRLVDVALTKTTDKTTLNYLGMMKEAWSNLHNIVEELGIVSNIRSVEIRPEPIELDLLIKSVYKEFKSLEWFDHIIFSLDLRLKSKFYSAPGLVRALFRNLFENSIKYATKRSACNFLKVTVVDHNEDTIRIEVADNGIGIKSEYHERIFDMFFRGTNCASGNGLGLYIVKCSLEKLNGAIAVESEEGKGTTFTIILPNNINEMNIKEKILQKKAMNLLDSVAS